MTGRNARIERPWISELATAIVALAFLFPPGGLNVAPADERVEPPYVDVGPLDEGIPAPESFLGHAPGEDAARYDTIVKYLHALAEASPDVTLNEHGITHEGRTLYHLTITSAANHARLEQIRSDNARLADPRLLDDEAQAARLVEEMPGIAWLAYSIHGDELSPCDSALVIAYLLAAGTGEDVKSLREELIINIDPLQNPDGRERYLAQIMSMRGKVPNPDVQAMHHSGQWGAGRGNHYLLDMNRDWLMQTQPETRARAAAILSWRPHLVVDAHEMGSMDTYLFDPPREPLNINLAPGLMKWRQKMSADQAAAFNRFGWSYYTKEWYDEWYPGYTNAWASLLGAVGLLYEQAGVDGDAVTRPTGDVFTYRQAVHQNVVSSFANLRTFRDNRRAILADFLAQQRWAVSEEGPFHESFLFPPSPDRSRLQRLLAILDGHAVEYRAVDSPVEAEHITDVWGKAHEKIMLPAGTVVVPATQPQRRLLHAILGFDPHMTDEFLLEERKDLENNRGTRMYGSSAWNLPMAFGVEAYSATRVVARDSAQESDQRAAPESAAIPGPGAFGYLVPFDDDDVYPLLGRLLAADCQVRVSRKPFTHNGRKFNRGAILIRRTENDRQLGRIVREAADGLVVEIIPVHTALSDAGPDLGARQFALLHEPRIAIASQWPVSSGGFGSIWFLLDQRIGVRTSPVNAQRLSRVDLRKYNVLILPSTWGLTRMLDEGAMRRLRTWVEAGGTLIAIGGSASSLADGHSGLSSVRRHRDVLEELDVYQEYVDRELAARDVTVNAEQVWRNETPLEIEEDSPADESGKSSPHKGPSDPASLKRADEWARTFSPRGTIVTGLLNEEHWLSFGLGRRLPLFVSGSTALRSKPPAQTPARLAGADQLRLSGLLWPETRPRLAYSAYATVERMGNGQVILFAGDPYFRCYWEGSGRMLLNAVFLGPGMGTSQPLPW
ncbi:MAG: hypothetical protein JSV91_07080 [Phycisphaerales bacterium]|nr:MAG: hypothetical protein JSV91_07080 [Phycisphaerales bacterium]